MSDLPSVRKAANSDDVVDYINTTTTTSADANSNTNTNIGADANSDATGNPVVRRRRRRIIRHVRDKTPEPSTRNRLIDGYCYNKYSDDDVVEGTQTTAPSPLAKSFDDASSGGGGGGGGGGDADAAMLVRRRAATVDDANAASTVVIDADIGVVSVACGTTTTTPTISGRLATTTSPEVIPDTVPLSTNATAPAAAGTHRSKILTMRDRGVGTSKAIRSQSSPRIATTAEDTTTAEGETVAGGVAIENVTGVTSSAVGFRAGFGGGGGDAMWRQPVKRSLSSPRHPEELLNRHFSRDNRAPAREIPEATALSPDRRDSPPSATGGTLPPAADYQQQTLTKLERNLRRFEEERLRFEQEKMKFEQEKRDAETALRNRRLQLFQRKREEREQAEAVDHDVHQKLCSILRVIEDSNKYHLPGISTQPMTQQQTTPVSSSASPVPLISASRVQPRVVPAARPTLPNVVLDYPAGEWSAGDDGEIGEDYESSTAKSTSSREGDFDDEDLIDGEEEDEECITVTENLTPKSSPNHRTAECTAETTVSSEPLNDDTMKSTSSPRSWWLSRLFYRRDTTATKPLPVVPSPSIGPVSVSRFVFVETRLVWHQLLSEHDAEWQAARRCRNRCLADLVVLMLLCGVGGLTFRFVEGSFENFYKCGVRRVKRDFVDHLWTTSHNLREDDWKTVARAKLRAFEEELHAAHEAGMTSYSGMKAWTFVNGLIYCLTVITTIGYGHIYPSTNTGRAITIIYALIGIPLFMILLNDFGKYFTWRIKFMVAFVRRLGNTSSLGRIYRQIYVQKIIRIVNKAYSFLTFKRNRALIAPDPNFRGSALDLASTNNVDIVHLPTNAGIAVVVPIFRDTAIDDAFDLPLSVALAVLAAYIAAGSLVYAVLEDWSIFEASYFAFVSMSTIGLGDFVPSQPVYMLGSIAYLVFGLALTSMCLSALQARLDGGLQRICGRIGAIIGLDIGSIATPATVTATSPSTGAPAALVKRRRKNVKQRPRSGSKGKLL